MRRQRWLPVALGALLVLVPLLAALVTSAGGTDRALDPASPSPSGARALARVLAGQGVAVQRQERLAGAARALAAAAPPAAPATGTGTGSGTGSGATLVVTDPDLLDRERLARVASGARHVVLLEPDDAVLRAVAPAVRASATARTPTSTADGCEDPAARAAGRALGGGRRLSPAPGAAGEGVVVCFAGSYAVVTRAGRTTTVLGEGDVVTNAHLADAGDAALALAALGAAPRVVWLVSSPLDAPAGARRGLVALLPSWVGALGVQLLLVAAAVVAWRARRLGALVVEPLPVVVRSTETLLGRAALYRAGGDTGASAAALRAGSRWRLAARLGLPPGSRTEAVADRADLAGQAGRAGQAVEVSRAGRARELLLGPAPVDEAGLVRLADDLDALEAAASPGVRHPAGASAHRPPPDRTSGSSSGTTPAPRRSP